MADQALAKRTRLTAVYLTAPERDLIVHGLTVLLESLTGDADGTYRATKFAKSYTCRRIHDVLQLFKDQPTKVLA